MKSIATVVCLVSLIGCGAADGPVSAVVPPTDDGGMNDVEYPPFLGDGSVPTKVVLKPLVPWPGITDASAPVICPAWGCSYEGGQPPVFVDASQSCEQSCEATLDRCQKDCGHECSHGNDCRKDCEQRYHECLEDCHDGGCRR